MTSEDIVVKTVVKTFKYFAIGLVSIIFLFCIAAFLFCIWLNPLIPLYFIIPTLVGWGIVKLTGEDGW